MTRSSNDRLTRCTRDFTSHGGAIPDKPQDLQMLEDIKARLLLAAGNGDLAALARVAVDLRHSYVKDTLERLKNCGEPFDFCCSDGRTAMHLAARSAHPNACTVILHLSLMGFVKDVGAYDYQGHTPFDCAIRATIREALETLKRTISPNAGTGREFAPSAFGAA